MTRWMTRSDAIVATTCTTFGSLILLGGLAFPFGGAFVAAALVVVAALMWAGPLQGPSWLPWLLVAVAAVMLISNPVGEFLNDVVADAMRFVAGGLLLAFGIIKLIDPSAKATPSTA